MNILGKAKMNLSQWYTLLCQYLWQPTDPASLGITRILFGVLMLADLLHERGFPEADVKWGNPNLCHFPLFDFLRPLPPQYMYLLYTVMSIGAVGITVGFRFKLSCLMFLIPYWYVLLLDKTSWNNHSYLYGLLSVILFSSCANHFWSIDGVLNPELRNRSVPRWNYSLFKFQIFLLYFYAGLKKFDADWLGGFSVYKLAHHWVFDPFKFLLTEDDIDYYIVHLGGFLLDLTLGFWLLWDTSRPFAMFFGASFHVMNSRLFAIGMFPYACLATLPIFCSFDWPRKCVANLCRLSKSSHPTPAVAQSKEVTRNRLPKIVLMALYVTVQLALPWSHNITQGYNNWTNGLYGYSWDMMVHGWQTMHIVVTVKENKTGKVRYLDSEAFTRTDKWAGHADMVHQYAHCVEDKLRNINITDISIYIDVWRSLNGRFQQRMFDPRVDILKAPWSPFQPTPWLLPLLTELSSWREEIIHMEEKLRKESENVSLAFVADFPGLSMENFIPEHVTNASLLLLQGAVDVAFQNGSRVSLKPGQTAFLPCEQTVLVHTTSPTPACYMYAYYGKVLEGPAKQKSVSVGFWTEIMISLQHSIDLTSQALLNILFGIPLKKIIN